MPFLIHAYCLMSTHIHLLLEAIDAPLWKIMQRLLGQHAQKVNLTLGRVGHLFDRRFGDTTCITDSHYKNAVKYIHNNPVRAKMVPTAADWEWSSHRELLGLVPNTFIEREHVLAKFGSLDNYERGLKDASAIEALQISGALFQSRDFCEGFFAEVAGMDVEASLRYLAGECASKTGLKLEDVIGDARTRRESLARKLFIIRAHELNIPGLRIARFLGRSRGYVSQTITKRGVWPPV